MRSETKMAMNPLPLLVLGAAALFMMSKGDEEDDASEGNINDGNDGNAGNAGNAGDAAGASDPSTPGYAELKQLSAATGDLSLDPENDSIELILLNFQMTQGVPVTGVFDEATAAELARVLAQLSPQ